MSSYQQRSRSNYFGVRNPEGFKLFCERRHVELSGQDGRYAFRSEDDRPWCDDGCTWETGYEESEAGEGAGNPDFLAKLTEQIADNDVAIVIEIGYEAARYLTDQAVAQSPGKEPIVIDLEHIYFQVYDKRGMETTLAEY